MATQNLNKSKIDKFWRNCVKQGVCSASSSQCKKLATSAVRSEQEICNKWSYGCKDKLQMKLDQKTCILVLVYRAHSLLKKTKPTVL